MRAVILTASCARVNFDSAYQLRVQSSNANELVLALELGSSLASTSFANIYVSVCVNMVKACDYPGCGNMWLNLHTVFIVSL